MSRLILATNIALAATFMVGWEANANELSVYNWSDYIDESVIGQFEEETGIDVTYDVFDSNEVLETKLLAGSTGYDLVVPSGVFLKRQIGAGVFQPLDSSKLSNWGNQWDRIQKLTEIYDPGNQYSVNYMWGTTGLGYNVDLVKEVLGDDAPTNSLSMIFDEKYISKLATCGVHLLDAPTEVLPAALVYLGYDGNSHDIQQMKEAKEVISKISPYVQKFHSSELIGALANGNICVALGWSGDILQARDRADEADNGITVAYEAPVEGALLWFDQLAIPADAPNTENAYKFIDFLLRADIAAANTNYVYYANGNSASFPLIEEEITSDPAIYPPDEAMKSLYVIEPYTQAVLRRVTRLWTQAKSGN